VDRRPRRDAPSSLSLRCVIHPFPTAPTSQWGAAADSGSAARTSAFCDRPAATARTPRSARCLLASTSVRPAAEQTDGGAASTYRLAAADTKDEGGRESASASLVTEQTAKNRKRKTEKKRKKQVDGLID